jgi:anti-anti-sigma regulatory factor
MLKITRITEGLGVLIKLEGKLMGPWVGELTQVSTQTADRASSLFLDLSAVTFVDEAGVRLLRELLGRGVQVVAASGFVAELLRWEKR